MSAHFSDCFGIIGTGSQENLSLGFSTRFDSNRAVQLQKMARGMKFLI